MEFVNFAGNKIRSIRKRKKIRTSELAKACGVSESEMRHLENGTRMITEAQIEKVAECLQVSPAALRSRNIVDYTDIMHLLFEVATYADIKPIITDEGTFLKIENPALIASIKAWLETRDKFYHDKISLKECISWEDNFPNSMPDHPPVTPFKEPLPSPDEIVDVVLSIREYSPDNPPDDLLNMVDADFDEEDDDEDVEDDDDEDDDD